MDRNEFRHELAQQLRVDSVRSSAAAGSGHPTSSMSAAELMAVLLDGGIGDAVLGALAESGELCRVRKLAVDAMPGSGSPEELIHEAGIDADAIATAARQLVGARATA